MISETGTAVMGGCQISANRLVAGLSEQRRFFWYV